ncbi:enoyl hydratase isomerase [Micractinium conductrix]|uniref:Enoyl hydratase isomerase n=1 Tax=Micractinium conductrix TaxID=554055 RepID=A0A2P6VKL1_9CHLO|nr:enoyl hydratase isomerase [Micractinium conductrix]|eukprot:PSC74629.1 enoyl hydratase isomerase [Micractinium conductrix]
MAESYMRVERHAAEGYALVVLAREPVNTMNLAFWQQLAATLTELEGDPAIRGAIFCSGLKRDVFTAGNDIRELYAPLTSRERYREFWVQSNRFLTRLLTSPLVTIAAIRGACPAGGCCLSMCCDYRVMTEQGSIGLNEVALGISVPKMWARLMARLVGQGAAERLLQNAAMLSPGEARAAGLVDEVVPKEKLLETAEAAMRRWLQAPDFSRAETKRLQRGEFATEWEAYAHTEADYAWDLLSSPAVVKQLGGVLARLGGGGAKEGGGGAKSRL